MNIIMKVQEGEQYKYRNFSWEGMSLFNEEQLKQKLGLDFGDIYREDQFLWLSFLVFKAFT